MRAFVLGGAAALLLAAAPAAAQPAPMDSGQIGALLDRDGRVELKASGVVLETYDAMVDGGAVEAVVARPIAEGRRPAIVMIPGFSRSARDYLPLAVRFAREGYAVVTVSQPGFGRSAGPADFAGPRTIKALQATADRFSREAYVDPARLGVYGYSRGALAAAVLATRTDLFHAAVLGGGVYDFRKAYDEVVDPGIRANMEAEAGLSGAAVRARSPILDLAGLDGPVLILHGEQDANAPVSQARALDARLTALGKPHELAILAGRDHALSPREVLEPALPFFKRTLGGP